MRNFVHRLIAFVALLPLGVAVPAAVVGPDASACQSGRPSVDVVVSGFKLPTGTLKVTLYDGDPARYLVKHGKLRNVIVPVHSTAPLDVCIAVPAPGLYAIALHHDLNGNDKKDLADGGGFSRNPSLSMFNLKPAFSKTGFRVGNGPTRTLITLLYAHGFAIGPAKS
ncbi:MAG: DUF2141 domain-containing protein [Pseudomonadota bacterium]|nr:DUF2141 domain-containing protein [Pseudomonadota bacterium]